MKLIISLFFILILTSFNVNAVDVNQSIEKKLKSVKPLLLDKSKIDLDKILKERSKFKKKNQNSFNVQKLKAFIPLLIVIGAILFPLLVNENKGLSHKKNLGRKEVNEWVTKKNKKTLDRERDEEWNGEEIDEWGDLKLKIEERVTGETSSYAIRGKGKVDIFDNLIKKDNNKAKFSISIFDITDESKNISIPCSEETYSHNDYLFLSREMDIEPESVFLEWSDIFFLPKELLIPQFRGKRIIEFILNVTSIDTKFLEGEPKSEKVNNIYYTVKSKLEIDYKEPGYSEISEFEEDVNKNIVQLAMVLAYSEKKMEQKNLDIIKNWINTEIIWKNYILDEEQAKENKMQYSFLLNNTHQLLKDKRLSMSNIIKNLNHKSTLGKKYEAINLLLNIAGADDKLSIEEDKLLNKTASALELNLERFQQMKTSTIANIEIIENNEENKDTIFNFTPEMTNEDKCKKLRNEYTRWNRQTNNSNEKIRNQAKKMVELTANLRKKYNC